MWRRILQCFPTRSDVLLEMVGRNLPQENDREVAAAIDWMLKHHRNDPRAISHVERYLELRRDAAHPNVARSLEKLRR